MKKLSLTTAILILAIATGFSQFNSGSKMVGASSSLDFKFQTEKDVETSETTKFSQFDFSLRYLIKTIIRTRETMTENVIKKNP